MNVLRNVFSVHNPKLRTSDAELLTVNCPETMTVLCNMRHFIWQLLVATSCRLVYLTVSIQPEPPRAWRRSGGDKRELSDKIRTTYNRWPISDYLAPQRCAVAVL